MAFTTIWIWVEYELVICSLLHQVFPLRSHRTILGMQSSNIHKSKKFYLNTCFLRWGMFRCNHRIIYGVTRENSYIISFNSCTSSCERMKLKKENSLYHSKSVRTVSLLFGLLIFFHKPVVKLLLNLSNEYYSKSYLRKVFHFRRNWV